jgi:hypothetical protein
LTWNQGREQIKTKEIRNNRVRERGRGGERERETYLQN